ncbi:hypothetical protein ElyMa_005062700 [Elysia marginata]|uniref:Uncharacterized protein n=1 Tax=Elysia marginata TaxID=1093978 RepID=A0AAV4JCX6_9GAST|nr:hypothetical protein ElyMa_005062700 [Elysia marginata]
MFKRKKVQKDKNTAPEKAKSFDGKKTQQKDGDPSLHLNKMPQNINASQSLDSGKNQHYAESHQGSQQGQEAMLVEEVIHFRFTEEQMKGEKSQLPSLGHEVEGHPHPNKEYKEEHQRDPHGTGNAETARNISALFDKDGKLSRNASRSPSPGRAYKEDEILDQTTTGEIIYQEITTSISEESLTIEVENVTGERKSSLTQEVRKSSITQEEFSRSEERLEIPQEAVSTQSEVPQDSTSGDTEVCGTAQNSTAETSSLKDVAVPGATDLKIPQGPERICCALL